MRKIYSLLAITAFSSVSFGQVVISQVYGGGGAMGAHYSNDFIELFNAGKETVTLENHSLQYANANAAFTEKNLQVLPTIIIEPGKYYLIQQAKSVITSDDLPSPDYVPENPLGFTAQAGKIALVSNTELIVDQNDADIVDFVGYGSANQYLGSGATPSLSTANSAQRKNNGCLNTKDNANDFVALKALARNGKTPAVDCHGKVVISQVYGGGGAIGAHYSNDFVELFNPGKNPVTLVNHSLQYANSNAAFTEKNLQVLPEITIEPGKYFLIQQAKSIITTEELPSPDYIPETPLSFTAQAGKLALVANADLIVDQTDADIVDFVGYGSANQYLGTGATPSLSTANSAQRKRSGCEDTRDNANDFVALKALARNGNTTAVDCETLSTADVNKEASKSVVNTLWLNEALFNVDGQAVVEIYNMNGQLVRTLAVNGKQNVNVSSLVSGVYIVKTIIGGQSVTEKVIKK